MNTVNFCDTSAIIKLYHDEVGSDWMEHSIRTLDALQLAACLNENAKCIRVICADANLLKVGEREGVTVINPEFQGVDA
jgi:hypothetical protein